MKSPEQILESVDRFRHSFWQRTPLDRLPVGVSPDCANMPINFLLRKPVNSVLLPDDVDSSLVESDYHHVARTRNVFSDDWIPFSSAWRAIPWLEAACGCPVRYASGSLAPGPCVTSGKALSDHPVPAQPAWLKTLARLTGGLVETEPPDCLISPSILRGPSDIIAAMRGMKGFFFDLQDHPDIIAKTAGRLNRLLADTMKRHFELTPPKHGGYSHVYGYWAPGPTSVIQEDALGMCSPSVYRELFREHNAEIVSRFGAHIFFHLHSTGYAHFRDVLDISGLAGLELTIEENGPRLRDMISDIRYILERSRLILFVYHFAEDIPEVLGKVPHDGLYLVVSDKFIPSEEEFSAFTDRLGCGSR